MNKMEKKIIIVFLLLVCKYYKSYMRCLVMSKQRNKDLDLIYGLTLASRFLTLFRWPRGGVKASPSERSWTGETQPPRAT